MSWAEIIRFSIYVDLVLVAVLIGALWRSRQISQYWPIIPVVLSNGLPELLLYTLRFLHKLHVIESAPLAYKIYFWFYWSLYGIGSVSSIIAIYKIFNEAMRPLKGLQDLGRIVFYWVAGISVALATSGALIPQTLGADVQLAVIVQLIRASSILVASLMLFVVFCIQPLGLTKRSRVFGVSVGLTIFSIMNLIIASNLGRTQVLYNAFSLVQTILQFIAEIIWIRYFWVPEPVRKFILLPTTSPFHKWNLISERLGHDPGYVAIGGVAPEHFASAEIEIFHRASAKMPSLAVPTAPQPVSPEQWLRGGEDN